MTTQKPIRSDIIAQLEEAQDLMREAHTLLQHVANALDDGHAKAYLVEHLALLIDDEHGLLSNDFNVQQWIKQVQEDDDLEDELDETNS